MNRSAEIHEVLQGAFDAEYLEVIDESEAHRGHAGYPEGGQSHFRVRLRTPELRGKSRIAQHRAVHTAIGPALMGQIHALALEVSG